MFGHTLLYSSLIALFWIYSIFAAPMAAEEGTMMEENKTDSCFKSTLPQQLQLHYDMCLGNNLSGENMMKENEILLCILKTAGVILEEEALDISKLKTPVAEEEALDMKPIEEADHFSMSVEKCEANEEMKKAEDFVQCLYEALSMNCTKPMTSNEEPAPEEMKEEN